MDETLHVTLSHWANFYLIMGSAAAALTGLQFVVQTLLTSNELRGVGGNDPEAGIAAFGTPTVVHFALALIVSVLMCVPWTGFAGVRATLGILGGGALVYAGIVLRRTHMQEIYKPTLEDWLCHVIFPAMAYATILLAAFLIGRSDDDPLFLVAGATIVLVCVGIHNAWDTVTYLTIRAVEMQRQGHVPPPPRRKPPTGKGRKR